nr:MAG TPA: hypothetical protein [Caudoviricetes sp.]
MNRLTIGHTISLLKKKRPENHHFQIVFQS